MEPVEFVTRRDALKGTTYTIVTTYSDQKREYLRRMTKLSGRLNIAWEDMIKLATVNHIQGQESDPYRYIALGRLLGNKVSFRLRCR